MPQPARLRCFYALISCSLALLSATLPAAARNTAKPEIRGLIDMGDVLFNHTPGLTPDNSTTAIAQVPDIFSAKIVNILWAQLQPNSAADLDTTAIDAGLRAIQTYNQTHPGAPLQAVLRVFGGPNSPEWVKRLGGAPVAIIHKAATWKEGVRETVGRFWSPLYRSAWRTLQDALAAKYDANPLISMVVVTSCSSITDESFILTLDDESRTAMLAAGFTDDQYRACLLNAADDYAAWNLSFLEMTFSVYHRIMLRPLQADDTLTVQVMQACRAKLGVRCVLSNQCIGMCDTEALYANIYAQFNLLGAPVSFEPYSPSTLSMDMPHADATVDQAVRYGASSLEVWPLKDGFAQIPVDHLRAWAAKLQSVPALATPTAAPPK